jgi:hypothetical protein
MALPIESLRPEALITERAERKAAVERLPAATSSQQFLKDTLLMVVGAKEKMEVSSGLRRYFSIVYRSVLLKREYTAFSFQFHS